MKQRNLALTIRYDDDHFAVDVYEPGGRGRTTICVPLSFDEHPEFDQLIGAEIYEWLALWKSTEE